MSQIVKKQSCSTAVRCSIFKRLICFVLLLTLLATAVLPVNAYTASGTQSVSSGDIDTLDAIFVNLEEYTTELFGLDPQSLTSNMIDDFMEEHLPVPACVATVKAVIDVFASSAYAFVDLGHSISQWSKAQKEIYKDIRAWYADVMICGANYMTEIYNLGVSHRGRTTDVPTSNLRHLQSVTTSRQLNLIHSIEEVKDHTIFKLSSQYRKQIQKLATAAREYYAAMPSSDLLYSLARYGSTDGTDNILTILTSEKCNIISKASGKFLNVYTNRAAKDLKNGDRISVYTPTGDDTQDFRFVQHSDGSYRIRVNDCKKYIDIYNTNPNKIPKAGAKVQVYSKSTEHYRDQTFVFAKENGYYRILLAANTKYCLQVKDNGYLSLAKVETGNESQLWSIVYPGDSK